MNPISAPGAPPQVALVTGAARRIGAEIARHLHVRGLNVILHYRSSAAPAQDLAAELNARRADSAHLLQGDLLATADLPGLAHDAAARWGRLDVLVNNASGFYPTPVGEITETQWEDLLGSNLKGPFFLSQATLPYLQKTAGCIVNLVDIHAERPMSGYPVYNIAKAGVAMLTKTLAWELGPQVRVNGVSPGAILWPDTGVDDAHKHYILERTALKRSGGLEDIARTVTFLALDAPYISGQILAVDGGRSLHM